VIQFRRVADDPTVRAGHGRADAPVADEHARYKPVREIARGGMGRVVEAVDTQLARTVAVKEVIDAHPDARARFEREVAITARLEHPSIVPLYDSGTSPDGTPFYVMRKVTGEPLDAKIRAATTLDQRLRLLPHVLALADAVAHAHARGVLHRDLKPSNVLVGALGETIVIDWGLAKLIGERDDIDDEPARAAASLQTVAGTVFGTPGFMAPEQVAGEEVDERADVFALGACLYYVLAGKRPFDGASETEIFERTQTSAPAPLTGGVPPDLVTIVEKAMAREKTQRYLDAGGFSEDLRRFLGGQLVAAHHYPLHVRILRWFRRHRALVAVTAIAVAILAAIGVWSLRRVFAEQARAEAALAGEHARADELVLFKVSTFVETDPTLAAASLQQIAANSPLWQSLGPMVANIRARGVAWGYPSTGEKVRFIDVAPAANDTRILVSSPGIVRVHDLALRTTRVLADDAKVWRARWCGPRVVVFRKDGTDQLLDVTSRAIDPVPWPTTATEVECADDGSIVWLDGGVLHTSDGKTAPVPDHTQWLERSRSGKWIVATSPTRVSVLHDLQEVFAFDATNTTVAFDSADLRVAIGGATETIELDLTQSPPTVRRRWAEPARGLFLYVGTDLHRWRIDRAIDRFRDDGPQPYARSAGISPEVDLAGRSAIIEEPKSITILSPTERYTLRSPEALDTIAATRDGRYLIAGGPARILVWDVSEVLATRTTVDAGDALGFIGDTGLAGLRQDGAVLKTGRYTIDRDLVIKPLAIGQQPALATLYAYPDGLVVVFDPIAKAAVIIEPIKNVVDVPNIVAITSVDDGTHLVAATADGAIHRIDRKTGRSAGVITTLDFPIATVASRAGTIAALGKNDDIWRRTSDNREVRSKLRWGSAMVAADGRVFLTRSHDLLVWDAAAPTVVATLPQKIIGFHMATANEIVVALDGGALYRFDRTTRAVTQLLPGSQWAAFIEAGLGVAVAEGAITIVDTQGRQIRLLDELRVVVTGLALSPDGRTVVAAVGSDHGNILHAWRIPDFDPHAWVMHSTNAIAPPTRDAPISWRP
jgi:hypothetical protein